MGEARDAAFYDAAFRNSKAYALAPEDCPWYPMWHWVVGRVRGCPVADLGCGPGHVAQLLAQRGHSHAAYLGIDFSPEAIRQARCRVPGFRFEVLDLRKAPARLAQANEPWTVILCEVLEHIQTDLRLLRALPTGTRVLATVPSYDSAGHVRHFPTTGAVCKRYEKALQIGTVHRIARCYGIEGTVL